MAIIFYPQDEELQSGSLDQKLEILQEAAERYKAVILDAAEKYSSAPPEQRIPRKILLPRDLNHAYNWEGIARILREIRELPETASALRLAKSMKLKKITDIYEILRSAKMPKLEAIRLALLNETNQLKEKI